MQPSVGVSVGREDCQVHDLTAACISAWIAEQIQESLES